MDAQGFYDDDYIEYNNKKTTKIIFEESHLFTKEAIIRAHQTDTIIDALLSLIPKYGFAISELVNLLINVEQSGSIDIFGLAVSVANNEVDENIADSSIPKITRSCLQTLLFALPLIFDVVGEDRESYVKNGVRLYAGDSFIDLKIRYDLGIEAMDFGIYFRQGTPICILEYGPHRMDHGSDGYNHNCDALEAEWRNSGYQLSEISDR